MAQKPSTPTPTVSSRSRHSFSIRLSSLLVGLLFIVLIGVSFYGGIIYERSQHHTMPIPTSAEVDRKFALGLVVYASSKSITIDNERTSNHQQFSISSKTLISLNGSPAKASQIKAGDIVLIRYTKQHQAAIILVNSSFSD